MDSQRGFAALGPSVHPPLLPSQLPRSVHQGSTNSAGHPFLLRLTLPLSNPHLDVQLESAYLPHILLNYSDRDDGERVQLEKILSAKNLAEISDSAILNLLYPRFSTTFRRINGPKQQASLVLRPNAACFGLTTTLYCLSTTVASGPDSISAHSSQHPFDNPVRTYILILARPWIMHACHVECLSVALIFRILGFWVRIEAYTKWCVRRFLKRHTRKTSCQTLLWRLLAILLPNSPGISVSVGFFRPLPTTARGHS